jgi:arabinose-5-phosphate isomerase
MQLLNMCEDINGTPLEIAKRVLEIEIEGIRSLMDRLDDNFSKSIDLLYTLRGRIIVTGVGKSGIIARKIAATLTSTGSPAIFVHPVDGLHGDVGIVSRDDGVIAISNSGETAEITSLAATIKKRGALIIGLTGVSSSTLGQMADIVLDCRVPREACPLNMAPTASTTATLCLGDALAVALMVRRGFRKEDFLRHHPAGSLGERLSLKVRDIMMTSPSIPEIAINSDINTIVDIISSFNLGFVLVTDHEKLLGIITDGDLRRALGESKKIYQLQAKDLMTANPLTINEERTAAEALEIMEKKLITALAVVNKEKRLIGIIHLHDLLGKGNVRFTS